MDHKLEAGSVYSKTVQEIETTDESRGDLALRRCYLKWVHESYDLGKL